MFVKTNFFSRIKIVAIVFLVIGMAAAGMVLHSADSLAQTSRISPDSIDFLTKTGKAMAEIAAAVKPAVVNISTIRSAKISGGMDPFLDDPFFRRFFGDNFGRQKHPREHKSAGLGSGVVVSSDGYIITNHHVVKDADEIKVTLSDKKEFKGKVVGTDPKTEIAVIKIDASGLVGLPWGNSDRLQVGELVFAVGNPFGLNQTVTMGIVSALGRANVGIADYEDFIQTDAAINPGNSGGGLINVRGELVGINTAIFSTTGGYQGVGFAIPSNMVKSIMESLIKKGKVIRGWLGVSIQKITPELAKRFNLRSEDGALIGDVIENSPAEKAGLKRGDVIIEYDGKKVAEPYILRNMVANTLPGEEHALTVIRENRTMTVPLTIGELPADMQQAMNIESDNTMKGIGVQDITPDIAKKMRIPERIKGVIVNDVSEDSPAAGILMPGDVIQDINRKKVQNLSEYREIVSKIRSNEDILMLIYRGGSSLFITISAK